MQRVGRRVPRFLVGHRLVACGRCAGMQPGVALFMPCKASGCLVKYEVEPIPTPISISFCCREHKAPLDFLLSLQRESGAEYLEALGVASSEHR